MATTALKTALRPLARGHVAPSTRRLASTASSAYEGENYDTHESFFKKPFLVSFATLTLAYTLYTTSLSSSPSFSNDPLDPSQVGSNDMLQEAEAERRPWLSRYLAYHFTSQSLLWKQRHDEMIGIVLESAENDLLMHSATLPPITRHQGLLALDGGSPFSHRVGSIVDMSDVKYKTFKDDLQLP